MKHLFVVLTNPVEGQEGEYNRWYDDQHIGDVLKVPGVKAARRFKLSDVQRNPGPYPHGYLALYEIEADDINVVLEGLDKAQKAGEMPMTKAMQRPSAWMFTPLSD